MEGDFSQRMGFRPIKPDIQLADISEDLRTGLWNVLLVVYLDKYEPKLGSGHRWVQNSNRHAFAIAYYGNFIKKPIDLIPLGWHDFLKGFKFEFFSEQWHRVYSLIEFMIKTVESQYQDALVNKLNHLMEREGSGYRIVAGKVCPITSEDEMSAVEEALESGSSYAGVTEHLSAAVRMLSDRQSPDYRNSIKESISAVESLAKQLTKNTTTLAPALSELEKHHKLHPALKSAFSSLYGWTSNADGIRHCLMDVQNLTQADARFMLITCSAFINFAIDSMRD